MPLTKIKLFRLKKGLLQWDLAQRVGVGESHFSKIETGRVIPSPEVLVRIADALGVSPEELREIEENDDKACQRILAT